MTSWQHNPISYLKQINTHRAATEALVYQADNAFSTKHREFLVVLNNQLQAAMTCSDTAR
jgi:hypothetical protein